MKEYTFTYTVETNDNETIYCEVTFKVELTPDQLERVINSYGSGKYDYLNEDDSISDIYDMVYEEAVVNEDNEENIVSWITYPDEIMEE